MLRSRPVDRWDIDSSGDSRAARSILHFLASPYTSSHSHWLCKHDIEPSCQVFSVGSPEKDDE